MAANEEIENQEVTESPEEAALNEEASRELAAMVARSNRFLALRPSHKMKMRAESLLLRARQSAPESSKH